MKDPDLTAVASAPARGRGEMDVTACPAHGQESMWRLAGGPWRCAICHPPARDLAVEYRTDVIYREI